ncbi:hypothetical protein RHSIM_Rhsim04G0098200 [Rhododendron simsii]|uniref:CCHC-type domain-containing protein n=1 Tax=Rhododendron simsii TaxID=118357 RepID=A0A834LR15_RHOSS|nr:hypothetical protein RHSIM_Rhsim04G0098200 [Rhododendron simsii]
MGFSSSFQLEKTTQRPMEIACFLSPTGECWVLIYIASRSAAIRIADIRKLLDISNIHPFVVNNKPIVYLNSRSRGNRKESPARPRSNAACNKCVICQWPLESANVYCSIGCKSLMLALMRSCFALETEKGEENAGGAFLTLEAAKEADNPFAVGATSVGKTGGGGYYQPRGRSLGYREFTADHRDNRQWEAGLKIDVPEFQGGLTPEEFLDWVTAIEEILEFKQVPDDRRVSLVATRFRGRAAAWWQQLKLSRMRQGKDKISSWEKLKKKMRVAFLPHNYSRLMYQRLQNLRQNMRSVDDYTTEFHQLVARNDLAETEEQLVARYMGGLREQFQFTLNMFDLCSVSDAHQRALQLERQANRRPAAIPWGVVTRPTASPAPVKPTGTLPPSVPLANKVSVSGTKCFKCGESGHRAFKCRKANRPGKALFVDADGVVGDHCESYEQDAVFDEPHHSVHPDVDVEEVVGDTGPLLVVRSLQQVHKDTEQRLQRVTMKYKEAADKQRRLVEFEVGDFVYAILTKDRYTAHEYNKLAARKVGPVEIIEKISPNAYRLKLPSHVRTADVFNVKHLIPFRGDSSDDEANSRANFFLEGEDDAVAIEECYFRHFKLRVAKPVNIHYFPSLTAKLVNIH